MEPMRKAEREKPLGERNKEKGNERDCASGRFVANHERWANKGRARLSGDTKGWLSHNTDSTWNRFLSSASRSLRFNGICHLFWSSHSWHLGETWAYPTEFDSRATSAIATISPGARNECYLCQVWIALEDHSNRLEILRITSCGFGMVWLQWISYTTWCHIEWRYNRWINLLRFNMVFFVPSNLFAVIVGFFFFKNSPYGGYFHVGQGRFSKIGGA